VPPLTEWADRTPEGTAIASRSGVRTFAELESNANRLVRALRSRGLEAGDGVALLCGNRPEFVEVAQATQLGGFRLTPINWHLAAEEASYIVSDCEAKALVADAPRTEVASLALEASKACIVGLAIDGSSGSFESYTGALEAESADRIEDPTPGTSMLYTSGTTGRPKGVYRPPGVAGGVSAASSVNLAGYAEDGGDVHLCTGPLYHAAPLAFSLSMPLAYGATVVLMEAWDAEEALRLIQEHGVTHTHMVPTMFHRLLALPDDVRDKHDVSTVKHILHGAAPCPVSVKRRMIDWLGPIIWEYYAATEGVGSFVDSKTWLERPGTVGKPFRPDQVVIMNEDGEKLPAGETGLVYIHAPGPAKFSYFKDTEKTASAFRDDYFTLGDVGHMDADGYLYLTDRSANLIISGGVNIYPAETDSVLLEHSAVGDVATIGLPDEEWGEIVVAVVEPRDSAETSETLAEELIAFCRQRLSSYKCPRRVEFIDELPRQDNGKIYKRLLRDRLRERATTGGGV
jgi:long-chain acyl-CoA synthetase